MRRYAYLLCPGLLALLLAAVYAAAWPRLPVPDPPAAPSPPAALLGSYSWWRTGPVEVALVFGRSRGCERAGYRLVEEVSAAALAAGLDPAVFAAVVAVESGCDRYAVSPRGAVGLAQVNIRAWKDTFDMGRVNLFNEDDNLRTGALILSALVGRYGREEGLMRYNGTTERCRSYCDPGYSSKVAILVGGRL